MPSLRNRGNRLFSDKPGTPSFPGDRNRAYRPRPFRARLLQAGKNINIPGMLHDSQENHNMQKYIVPVFQPVVIVSQSPDS